MTGRLTAAILGAVNQTIHLLMTPKRGAQPPGPQTCVLNSPSRDRLGKQTETRNPRDALRWVQPGAVRLRGKPEVPSRCPAPVAGTGGW